jgi:ElaA protein
MPLTFKIKPFKELSLQELYNVLKLRTEVFVVEQECVYQDMDNKDQKALHLLGFYNDELVAYSRLFNVGDYFENASIGRVIVAQAYRDRKWGHELIRQGIEGIALHYKESKITISAQLHLQKFYERHGFKRTSDMYLEDNIPHIQMKIV